MGVLDLSYNKLTGALTNLPLVQILLLQNNRFRGLILNSLCTRTGLVVLDLLNNRLTGKIPKFLWSLDLVVMILSSNMLSGGISTPSPLWPPSMQWLQLNDNSFNGELPRVSGYFINLVVLDLGENKFSGDIPKWIGENRTNLWIQGLATNLGVLRLHKNNFSGEIPYSLCKCQSIQILDLAQNNLTGSIPRCFGDFDGMKDGSYSLHISTPDEIQDYVLPPSLDARTPTFLDYMTNRNMTQVLQGVPRDYTKNLKYVRNMDLSSNKLVGEIHEALTTLKELMGLNLSYNRFSGEIPEKIGNMKSLISLDLSTNKLTRKIPSTMAALTFLSHLNLSHNNLSGQIPTGNQLRTLTDSSIFSGNTYLCGAPLPNECSPHVNTRNKNKHENEDETNKVWFYLNIMSGLATGFWGIIGVLLFKKQWRQKLFMYSDAAIDKLYVAVVIRVSQMRIQREDA